MPSPLTYAAPFGTDTADERATELAYRDRQRAAEEASAAELAEFLTEDELAELSAHDERGEL